MADDTLDPNSSQAQGQPQAGPLDDVINLFRTAKKSFDYLRSPQLQDDLATITKPGMGQDLWKYAKEKITSYPGGAPADESTPTMDLIINTLRNTGKLVTSQFDPENPIGSIALGPVGKVAKSAEELSQVGKEASQLGKVGKIESGRFVGGRLETTPSTFAEANAAAKAAKAAKASQVASDSPALTRVKQFLNSSSADRELSDADKTKAIIRAEQGRNEMDRFTEAGHDEWQNFKAGVKSAIGIEKSPTQQAIEQHDLAKQMSQWYRRPPEDGLNMIRRMEGKPTTAEGLVKLAPQDEAMAQTLIDGRLEREAKIDALAEAGQSSASEDYTRNFMSHMFEDPKQARQLFDNEITNMRIARGKNFSMPDSGELLDKAIDAGLKLRTNNPIEFSLMKTADMDRFILGQNIKGAMEAEGLAIPHGEGTPIPQGWVKLDSSSFGGKTYWAQPDAAKIFNTHFAPGISGNTAYQVLKGVNNDLNMAQLGFSGFHALMESANSGISDLAYAAQNLQRGNFGEAGKAGLRALSIIGSPINDSLIGGKMMQEALRPGSFSKYADEVRAIAQAGGRVTMDPSYFNRSLTAFQRAVQDGNWGKAVARSLPALMEGMSKPLMEWYVPRIKLGAFQRLAAQALQDAKRLGWSELQTKTALQSAWDSIDNRFGQLVYSNLFWNKTAKDVAMVAMRAPGWNIGTVRELGGGVLDLAKQSGRLIAEGKFDLTNRMAYTMALPVFTGYVGALWHYFMTGKIPQEARDYFFPGNGTFDKNGNMNRDNFPSYVKDVLGLANHPLKTVLNKAAPGLNMAAELIQNKDFYSTQIWKPGAGMPVDIAKYLADQLTSFSLRNYKKKAQEQGGNSMGSLVESIIGIQPAPREFVKTPAENIATDFLAQKFASETLTPEAKARRDNKAALESSFRRGAIGVGDLVKAVGTGKISQRQLEDMIHYKNLPLLARDIKLLEPEQAYEVWKKANPQQKPLILKEVRSQFRTGLKKSQTPKERQEWARRLLETSSSQSENY